LPSNADILAIARSMHEGYGEAAVPMLEKRAGDCAREGGQGRAAFWSEIAKAIRELAGAPSQRT
jgi:hypothetical protein